MNACARSFSGAPFGITRLSIQRIPPSFGTANAMSLRSAMAWATSPLYAWITYASPDSRWSFTSPVKPLTDFRHPSSVAFAWARCAGSTEFTDCPWRRRAAAITSRASSRRYAFSPVAFASAKTAHESIGPFTLSVRHAMPTVPHV
jgi:hypothetical protein